VAEFHLEPKPFLGGYHQTFGQTSLSEVTGLAIVSIAIPRGGETELQAAFKSTFGTTIPKPGKYNSSEDGAHRFAGLQIDQIFALFETAEADPANTIAAKLAGTAYTTSQTDNWVALQISGPQAIAALERICPIDLHPTVFSENSVARTVMDHMGTIILRQGPDDFLLLSASSSARSFLHAVETSLRHVT